MDAIDVNKITINNLNVKYMVYCLNERILNGYIQKVQMLDTEDSFLKIKINNKIKNETLVVGKGVVIISKYAPAAKLSNKGFSFRLNQLLDNKRIMNIVQKGNEKIIEIQFFDYNLIFELFSHNNIILTNKEYIIIDCLLKEDWKTRTIKPKEKYILPDSESKDIINYKFDITDFDYKKNLVPNFLNLFNISPGLVETILTNEKIDKINFSETDIKKVLTILKSIYSEQINTSNTYIRLGNKIEFYHTNLKNKDIKEVYENLNDILDDAFVKNIKEIESKKSEDIKNKEKQKIIKMIAEQEKKMISFEKKSEEYKKIGDLIYDNYAQISEIIETIKIAREKNVGFDYIESKIINNKKKYTQLEIFKKIDKKEKNIIFTLLQQ